MSTTLIALTGLISWFMVLLIGIIAVRVVHTHRTGKPINSYLADGSDVSPFSTRICAAHINFVESAPFIVGIPLMALATGHAGITDSLALYTLAARIGQSSVHLGSTSEGAVKVRATLFIVQVVIACYWLGVFALQ